MKKPSSIRDHVKILSSTVYPHQKIKLVFSLRTIIYEFFQKKLNYIKATKLFLYDLLPRVLSASGVIMRFKKRLSMQWLFRKTRRPLTYL